ncbi:hypothetical protein [Fulvivirga ligni]|uniref:hypothetical protein n=1 Tax=Fulvivirga ligni TaxID=2904246 RepID=UPI001F215A6E|nr:hypothetical protein [Fulvivirga ligni]UII21928.1 hypothetical protein LVD16_01605 [Fulvivirga ligni]
MFVLSSPEAKAQGKRTEYEKVNRAKNKKNRRLKRRGDKGKSNRQKVRATRFKIRSRQGERAYQGDITGRRFSTKRSDRPNWGAKIAKPDPYAGRKRSSEGSRAKASRQTPRYSSRKREKAGSAAGRAFNTQSVRTSFTGKARYRPGIGSGRSASRPSERKVKSSRISPRSASGAYNVRRKKNPYSAFRRKTPWERAYQGDITGRKFRAKKSSINPILQRPGRIKYTSASGRRGDRAYNGKMQGGHVSATRGRERAWRNDISGHKLRNSRSKRPDFGGSQFQAYPTRKRKGDRAFNGKLKGGGFKSVSSRKERAGSALPQLKAPSLGAGFRGKTKRGKVYKGGGSVSGKRWNNGGRAVQGRGPKSQDTRIAGFQGNVKGGRILKGGGSISDRTRNNGGRAVQGRGPRRQDQRIARFQGNAKGGKVLKGGGSISGNLKNNNGRPVQSREPRSQDRNTARFQGNVKGGKVLKGGGSISGQPRNNNGRPVQSREPRSQDRSTARFQGNIKGGRPIKGGGSVSGQLWNNKERPIKSREPVTQDRKSAAFQGNIKYKKDQIKKNAEKSANFKGNIKMFSYMNDDGPDDAHKYRGDMKRGFKYKKNPNSAEEALKVRKPDKNFFKTGKYTGTIKDKRQFKQNPSAADASLKNRPRGEGTAKGMAFKGRFKTNVTYKTRPHSAEGALKGKGPSKAAVKASDYQGNIKMRSKRVGDRHPDFKYLSLHSNGKKEKDKFFSFKILWSKLFKKEENQPDNLKYNGKKPRYDKREKDLWND